MDELHTWLHDAADPAAEAGPRLAAFERIVRRFADMAYGCAHAILGDFHLAQDAAQEAFLTAWRRLADLREPAAFPGWLRRLVVSHCHRILRRRRKPPAALDAATAPASPEPRPDEQMEQRELQAEVLAAVRGLPDAQRMATTLFYINGYSQADIAAFLEVPLTTVKKRLHDARRRLKERMMHMVEQTLRGAPLPDDFADVVVRKAASRADLDGAAGLLNYSARKRPAHFDSPQAAEAAGIFVVGRPDHVEGAGYFNEFRMSVGSTVLTCARPDEVGAEGEGVPHPAFVRSMAACCQLARQRGIHLAVVHSSQYDNAFCGMVPCFFYPVARLAVEVAERIETDARLVEAGPRQQADAQEAFLADPWAPKIAAFIGGGTVHVIQQDGRTVGYCRLNRGFRPEDHYHMPFGFLTDLTVRTRAAALAAIREAGRLAAAAGEAELCMMQSHRTLVTRTMLALGGAYLLRGPCDLPGLDSEMVAILDLPGLTGELAGEFQSRFAASAVREAAAGLSIEMAGQTVGFLAEGGRLRIVHEPLAVHRRLPRWLVTRLCVGFYGGEDLPAMGPIPWDRSDGRTPDEPALDMQPPALPAAEAALLGALFPRLWPVAWPDPDVWPWVIGRPHPRYQNEARKTAEMKAAIDALQFPWFGR